MAPPSKPLWPLPTNAVWDFRSHRANKNAATRPADEYRDPFLSTGFTAAERFHIHFHHGDIEDYQIAAVRPSVRVVLPTLPGESPIHIPTK